MGGRRGRVESRSMYKGLMEKKTVKVGRIESRRWVAGKGTIMEGNGDN